MTRGDVVLVPFPFQDKSGEKIRPALVVQSNAENQRLANTILAMLTGNLDDSGEPTTILIDPGTQHGASSGLKGPSLVKCYNLATMRQTFVGYSNARGQQIAESNARLAVAKFMLFQILHAAFRVVPMSPSTTRSR